MELSGDLPPALVPLAWLIGTWAGAGVGGYPSVEQFRFGQEVVFAHDGRPFLSYQSRTWLLDEDGNQGRPLGSEAGFWRCQPEGALEVALSHPTGYSELWIGQVEGPRIELRTDVVVRTATAKEYTAGHRLYGLVEGDLAWAFDMAAVGQPIQAHLSARLKRSG
jgi:hypothetical protein